MLRNVCSLVAPQGADVICTKNTPNLSKWEVLLVPAKCGLNSSKCTRCDWLGWGCVKMVSCYCAKLICKWKQGNGNRQKAVVLLLWECDAWLSPLLDLVNSRSECRTPGGPLRLVPSKQAPNKYPAQPETVNWGGERDSEPSRRLNTNNIWYILVQKVPCLLNQHRTAAKACCGYFRGN